MEKLVIFCKSYKKDIYRARRMAESVQRFNCDGIQLIVCVSEEDLPLFESMLRDITCIFLKDEDVLEQCYKVYGRPPELFPKHLMQQLIKMEFWRMGLCDYYLWIDSDSYFLTPFSISSFFGEGNIPRLVMHKSLELRTFAQKHDQRIIENLDKTINTIQGLFGRKGESFYFGDPPLLWSCSVMELMYYNFLEPKNISIFELLYKYPCEMQLYGEFCLATNSHKIIPTEPFFKVFHYLEQFCESQQKGESEYSISKNFLGVVMQSNWTNVKERKKHDFKRFRKFLRNQRLKWGGLRW